MHNDIGIMYYIQFVCRVCWRVATGECHCKYATEVGNLYLQNKVL